MKERWKPVPGYKGFYKVSDYGRVKSLARMVVRNGKRTYPIRERILKASSDTKNDGRLSVSLSKKRKAKTHLVHLLVLVAFVGRCPKGKECCHWDGDPTNNHLENLRYGTRSENNLDKRRHGTDNRGSQHPRSVLNEKDAVEMRNEYARGDVSQKELASRYTVVLSAVSQILSRKTWTHVGGADCSSMLNRRKIRRKSKLTDDQVRDIRKRYAEGGITQQELGSEFGVTHCAIGKVVKRKSYKDVV